MDDYKRLFYMNRPDLVETQVGDVTNRLKFRDQKQCKPFKWYLENIYPQKFILDSDEHVFAYGRVRNEPSGLCVDTLQHDDKDTYNVGVYSCHAYVTSSQFFSFSRDYQLRREDSCAIGQVSHQLLITKKWTLAFSRQGSRTRGLWGI